MNYFPFHVGDYAAHTAHLEPMEDLAYRRLLDVYYLRDGPLPADIQATAKLVRMRSMAADVESVLREFFTLTDDGWRHSRCDAEIAHMQDKQAKAKASAQVSVSVRRANAERMSANAERTLPVSQANVELPTPTPTPTPTPRENTHTPLNIETESREATAAGRVCRGLREAGIQDTNPGHPVLLALLEAGAADAEIVGAAAACVSRGKGFAYLLGMVKKQRAEAAAGMVRGAMPPAETTYARMMRERMEQIAPAVAVKRPNGPAAAGNVIDMEAVNVASRRLG